MKSVFIGAAWAAIAAPLAAGAAGALSSVMQFEVSTTTPSKSGALQPAHISIQSWGLSGDRGRSAIAQHIPLQGFYVAHLLSGGISTTIDGQTTKRLPGDYWTVKAGTTMQVRVLGEYAMLETIAVTKQ